MDINEAKEILNLSDYEKNLISLYGINFNQIKWYRWKLKNDCSGDTDLMKQENP